MSDLSDRGVVASEGPPTPVTVEANEPAANADAERGYWVLATLVAGAGAIHLALAPSHLAESTLLGTAFLVSGALQLALALWLAIRPTRVALWVAIATSVGFIGVWAISRTIGLPLSGHAGEVESVNIVDRTCVVLEGLAVLVAGSVLARRGGILVRSSLLAVTACAGSLLLVTAALASPAARDHAQGHGHDDSATGGHSHATEDDRGFSALANGQMGSHVHPGGDAAPAAEEIDPTAAATLAGQLALTAPLVQAYPTLGAARAAGFVQQGPFSPGLGVHFGGPFSFNSDGDMDPEDIARPILIFDGLDDSSALAGFMYMAYQETEPEGFAGPLDRWHYHTATCLVYTADGIETPFGADLTGVTDAMCEAEGGRMIDFTGYMVHVWTVPGYESDLGTFSDLNPKLTCSDGTYYVIPTAEIGSADTTCRNEAA